MESFFVEKEIFANIGLQNQDIFFYNVTDSTNTRAREYFFENSHCSPALFVAKEQTGGRGTRGRSFESGEGGLYLSVLLPSPDLDSSRLTAMAAAAVYLALCEQLTARARKTLFIKWVNDLYLGRKKVSGILCERIGDKSGEAFIVGIGINLYGSPFSPEVEKIATSVEGATGIKVKRDRLLLKITEALLSVADKRTARKLCKVYRRRSLRRGTPITVTDSAGLTRKALVRGLDDDFSLRVRYADGEDASLISADVSIRI